MNDATPSTPLLVHCHWNSWNSIMVSTLGLKANFTLSEVLVVLGNDVVLDLFLHKRATCTTAVPIAWPVRLKRGPPDAFRTHLQPFAQG